MRYSPLPGIPKRFKCGALGWRKDVAEDCQSEVNWLEQCNANLLFMQRQRILRTFPNKALFKKSRYFPIIDLYTEKKSQAGGLP